MRFYAYFAGINPHEPEMKDMILNKEVTERAVLVGLVTPAQSETKAKEYLDELEFLADTAGAETVKTFTQKLDYPNPRTFVGKGKLEEIREYIEANDIGMAIFDDDLTSKQVSNIESELKVKILDRTSLILDILPSAHRPPMQRHRSNWRNTNICCPASPVCGHTSSVSVAA